ncbi:permease [Thaumasiovibrio subtropicus]|uniref:permease n=1 Tax=Thaumasiovibrio subtropicus TaxID=1891207 RepID=UPI000B357A9D|nr:permease [Thaumasiovibrio subtropicus]
METSELSSWEIALNEFIYVGGALFLIIAFVALLTGVVKEYVPQGKLQKKLAKHEKHGPLVGSLLGTLTPFCSASMVPVVMSMVSMGASIGTIFGFLISAPLCNFVVVGVIFTVFGFKVAAIYLLLTLGGAMLSGYLIGLSPLRHTGVKRELFNGETPSAGSCEEPSTQATQTCGETPVTSKGCAEPVASSCDAPIAAHCETAVTMTPAVNSCDMAFAAANEVATEAPSCGAAPVTCGGKATNSRMQNALGFAFALFKKIMPYVLVGAFISALSAAFLPAELVEKYVGGDNWFAIPIAAVIGIPLYLRIEMAIPLLQVLISKGMGMGAAMAVLIGGTGASLPEIAIISSILRPKAVVAFVVSVVVIAITGGVVFSVVGL